MSQLSALMSKLREQRAEADAREREIQVTMREAAKATASRAEEARKAKQEAPADGEK
jgi:hypothetical protein